MEAASKLLAKVPVFGFWILVALIPLEMWRLTGLFETGIGCPVPATDCYVPGAEYLLEFELAYMGAALLLWPLVIVKVVSICRAIVKGTP